LLFDDDDGIVVVGMRRSADVAAAPKLMTADEYFATPETLTPMELAFGVMRVADAPTPRHQAAVGDLFRALDGHVRERKMGRMWLAPLDVVLDDRRALIVQPDLMFISNERDWIVRDRVRGGPDLVVEVLSPNSRIGSTDERVGWFGEYGVRECWLVHLDRRHVTVVAYANRGVARRDVFACDEPIASTVLPEFRRSFEEILAQ
jgi:Uma2 family endonuclease